jgi:HK97 family phage portal protein
LIGGAVDVVRRPRNESPVPYSGRGEVRRLPFGLGGGGAEAQMRAMGAVGTLFAIVNRTSTAAAAVNWRLWQKAASGKPEDRVEKTRHLALDIWTKPNPFMPRQEFVETFQQHVDLTGEGWWVVARNPALRSIPLELWPVRPDRMTPVPHREKFLAGYVYTSPDGEQVPLALDEVIQIRMPNPLDPYRGMGPVQAILVDLDAEKYTAEWNRSFFRNSAEPGGIIEVDRRLEDTEFDEMTSRWREQHQGVANAHRVAILEHGKWVDRKFTQRDMQFAELRAVSKDTIREAFGMPKFAVGDVADVNRATAEASKAWFAEQITVPRLERIKGALNNDFLPLFGATAVGLEWDFDSPVAADREADNAELTARSGAAKALVEAGYDRGGVLTAVGLPDIAVAAGPVVAPEPAPAAVAARRVPFAVASHRAPLALAGPRNAADLDPDDLPDVTPLQGQWERALARLLARWEDLSAAQKATLVAEVKRIATSGTLTDLTGLTVDSAEAAAALEAAMADVADLAARRVVAEAAAQDVTVAPKQPGDLAEVATVVARMLAAGLVLSAAGAAMRANGPGVSAGQIADAVAEHLDSLTDAEPRRQLGGALTGAQNAGRIETLRAAPEGALYASEKNDSHTCGPCLAVNGRWLGNISQMDQVEKSYPGGAYGAYVDCLGRERCRGTVTGVWRPAQTGGSGQQ